MKKYTQKKLETLREIHGSQEIIKKCQSDLSVYLSRLNEKIKIGSPDASDEFARSVYAARLLTAHNDSRNKYSKRDIRDSLRIPEFMNCMKRYCMVGAHFSGDTFHQFSIARYPNAFSETSKGESYSRKCAYKKTNVTHFVHFTFTGLAMMSINVDVVDLSAREGLPLIHLGVDGSAAWITVKAGKLGFATGFIAHEDGFIYHAKSKDEANRGLKEKILKHKEQKAMSNPSPKDLRRARLVVRLCNGALATYKQARDMGYCVEGIKAFKQRHNIKGNKVPLPQLMLSGNQLAINLALRVARVVKKEKTKQTV